MDKDYTEKLEKFIKQMLSPIKDVPFNVIIQALTSKKVISFDLNDSQHKNLLLLLTKSAILTGKTINKTGIERPRPNEVGNDIEPFVKKALNSFNLKADIPTGPDGIRRSAGYPDIIFWFNKKPYYLECKTYNIDNISTTQRTFYFSPSDDFKVIYDAPHLLISFEIYVAGESGSNHIYKCKHYKILSLDSLSLDLKFEFNSDNKRMYSAKAGTKILDEGEIT